MRLNRFIFLVVLMFVSCLIFARDLTIVSFNVQGHGPWSSKHRLGQDRWEDQIISIIKKSNAELVLLQEFPIRREDTSSIANFMTKLNKNWQYETSAKYSTAATMDLNNAILYNSKYLTLVKDLAYEYPFNMYKYKQNPNEDLRKYKFIKNNEQILEFIYAGNPAQSFYVVNVHIPGPDEETKKNYEIGEISKLYALHKRKIPLIIAGDFNARRRELLRGTNLNDAIVDGDEGKYIDDWGQKTTVTRDVTNLTLSNDYDHFIISRNPFFSVAEQMHLVFSKDKKEKFDKLKIAKEKYTNSSDYQSGLSDHLPIMIKLKINK